MTVGRLPSIDGGIQPTIVDAKGDLITAVAADTPARLAVGTNGQVLKANSATATGLEWAADSAGMTNPMTTTGDTIYSSSGSTPARLGIGSTGQVLTVASGVPTWATPSGANKSFTLINTGGTTLSGSGSVSITGISGVNEIYILIIGASTSTAPVLGRIRINNDSSSIYSNLGANIIAESSYSATVIDQKNSTAQNGFQILRSSGSDAYQASGGVFINGCNSSGVKMLHGSFSSNAASSTGNQAVITFGAYTGTSTVSSVQFIADSATFDAGTIFVYGA